MRWRRRPEIGNFVLRVLEPPPEDVACEVTYTIEDRYGVCIHGNNYHVYDLEPPAPEKKEEIEKKVAEMLVTEDVLPSEIIESIPDKYRYMIERQFIGYGVLDPFFRDPDIIDVHIVHGQRAQVIHRNHGKLVSNVEMSLEEMQRLARSMTSPAGKDVSEARPLISFIEPVHEARVTIVFYSDVTMRRGMTIDIRKQPKKPWTILKLIDLGTLSFEEAAYLWLMILYRVPIMIVGELMSGKTVLANAILNTVPPDSRVMTIEDAPELRLYVPYWTRTTVRESDVNPVTIFDLLRVAMRITPDYIVVGEVRGKEARDWAQGILLGHGGLTTFHAESPEAALLRLRTEPILVDPQALRLLNIFVKMIPIRTAKKLVRRSELFVHDEDGSLHLVFRYDPDTDNIVQAMNTEDMFSFKFIGRVILAHGVTKERILREYAAMVKVLRTIYEEYKEKEPGLERPDYEELPYMMYERLREELRNEEV